MPSQKTKVTTYAIPAGTQFTVAMHPQREILAIEPDPRTGGYTFLVEQPAVSADGSDDQSTKNFSFQAVALNERFDNIEGDSYLGQIGIVIDPNDDRPVAETYFVYGVRKG